MVQSVARASQDLVAIASTAGILGVAEPATQPPSPPCVAETATQPPSPPRAGKCAPRHPGFAGQDGCIFKDSTWIGAPTSAESLNSDPYNLRAEEFAMLDCTQGVEIRRTWSEKEMVRAIDGHFFPGTPDGMFENWDGALTCVQVVRVPLVFELSLHGMQETLAQTIMTKIVKSQQWLRASHVVPHDFIIFCWLPFFVQDAVAEHAENLMQQVRLLDPRFSLRLRVPAQPGALFPALFASNHEVSLRKARGYSWTDITTYSGSEPETDEEEECAWDITWGWEEEWSPAMEDSDNPVGQESQSESEDSPREPSWDITWGWEADCFANEAQQVGSLTVQLAGDEGQVGKRGCCMCKDDSESEQNRVWDDGG